MGRWVIQKAAGFKQDPHPQQELQCCAAALIAFLHLLQVHDCSCMTLTAHWVTPTSAPVGLEHNRNCIKIHIPEHYLRYSAALISFVAQSTQARTGGRCIAATSRKPSIRAQCSPPRERYFAPQPRTLCSIHVPVIDQVLCTNMHTSAHPLLSNKVRVYLTLHMTPAFCISRNMAARTRPQTIRWRSAPSRCRALCASCLFKHALLAQHPTAVAGFQTLAFPHS